MTRDRVLEAIGWALLFLLGLVAIVSSIAADEDHVEAVGTAQCGPIEPAPSPEVTS